MGIFSQDSNGTCPMPSHLVADAPEPFIGGFSFHQFNMILSGSCAIVSTVSIGVLMARHAFHFSKPNEQKKIMQICSLIPCYSILCFISIAFPNSYFYLLPWLDCIQAVALGNFFLLLCEYVSPRADERETFFVAMQVPQSGRRREAVQDGLEWYRKKWIAVFQYTIVAPLVAIATDITQVAGIYCYESSKPHFAHLWLSIIAYLSVIVAVLGVFKFYTTLKSNLKQHKPLSKFLAFKLIIGLTFLERILFQVLRSSGALHETSQLTYADVNLGIQTMIICLEMVPFSIFFHYAYSVSPYILTEKTRSAISTESLTEASVEGRGAYQGGLLGWKAWVAVVDPREILRAIRFAFIMRSESRMLPTYNEATGNSSSPGAYKVTDDARS